ncbi:MAG TPA: DUF3810 domain-containing protein [Chitinophagaceae bacterium]|nr:DUF3810 domain-containing protein [Chitinophagaceae bacterium]
MKTGSWVLLIIMTILIKFASTQPLWVEENFATNIYPVVSKIQRGIFGWIPFSVGDIFYSFLVFLILFKTGQLVKNVYKKKINRTYLLNGLKQLIFFFLSGYVLFYGLWGLNYSRPGIRYQLSLEIKPYTVEDIDTLTGLLQQRLNLYAATVNEKQRDTFSKKKILFEKATEAYMYAENSFPFLSYSPQSIKPSLYSYPGNFLGFQGYYNPFTGEGQVNTTIPRMLEPYVTAHEIAHQLGYARENDANFVAFLACRSYPSEIFRYSMYFDLYSYSVSELFRKDSLLAKTFADKLHPQVKKDFKELRDFYKKYKNNIEPVITWLYGNYLQANNQPEGKRAYNQVVAYLIAYYKKFGKEAI